MLSRRSRIQAAVFVVIAVVGVSYTALKYAGLDRLLGTDAYHVTVELGDSGGIFANAAVAYRGVTVGRVESLRIADYGTEVHLAIDRGTPPIPAGTKAIVTTRSVIGEQYVDLQPGDGNGPYLKDGSTIPLADTKTPLPIEEVLLNLNALLASVPNDALRTVVDELDTGTTGTGPAIDSLIDSGHDFVTAARAHTVETKDLITKARTVLRTQIEQTENMRTFASGFRSVADQLKKSDPDLRRIISSGPDTAGQLSGLIRESGPGLGVLLANLLSTTNVVASNIDGIEQILVGYPVLVNFTQTVVPGDGTAHLGFIFNAFDPLPCTKGYEGTRLRPANDTTTQPSNPNAHCAEPPGSPTSVRGAQNAPTRGGR